MIIREMKLDDMPRIIKIYDEFYSDNEYPSFFSGKDKFQCPFVIENSNDIIVAGGIRTIAEAMFVTDKNKPTITRVNAMLQGLGSSILIAKEMGYRQIHAFVNHDEKYVDALQKIGFKLIDAKLLVLDLGEFNG